MQCIITATDRGIIPKTALNSAIVNIAVIRNTAPFFSEEIYRGGIDQDVNNDHVVTSFGITDRDIHVSLILSFQLKTKPFSKTVYRKRKHP